MPENPFLGDGGQNLSRLLMSLGSGFSMASAANQPWWAGIGPAAAIYGQSQAADEDRAYRQRQADENNAYRKLQEEQMRAVIDERKAAIDARKGYTVPGFGVAPSGAAPTGVGMGVPTPPPTMGGGQNVNIPQAATAIGTTESGNNYSAVGPVAGPDGDRAWGKYQIMGKNIGPWTREVLGREWTPQDFIANTPEANAAQDAVFNSKFGAYANKYGPEGAARAWFAGEGGMNNPNAKDVLGTTVAGYGRKFADLYGMQNPEAPPESYRGPGTNPMPPLQQPVIPPVTGGPPTPIVPVGGSTMDRVALMPQPEIAPEQNVPAHVASRIQDMVQRGLITPQQGDAETLAYVQKDQARRQAILDKQYAAKLEEWKFHRGEESKAEMWEPVSAADALKYTNGQPPQPGTVIMRNKKNGDIKVSGAPLVNLNTQTEGAFNKQLAEQDAKRVGEIQENTRAVIDTASKMRLATDLLSRTYTGAGGDYANAWFKTLGSLGIKSAEGKANAAEAATAIVNEMMPRMRAPGSGSTSDMEMRTFAGALPSMLNLPGGNEMATKYWERIAERQIAIQTLAEKHAKESKGLTGTTFTQDVKNLGPLFTKEELDQMRELGKGDSGPKPPIQSFSTSSTPNMTPMPNGTKPPLSSFGR